MKNLDSKDSKAFHEELFDVEDELIDFIDKQKKELKKAIYPGNLGLTEMYSFMKEATPGAVARFNYYLKHEKYHDAIKLLESHTGKKFHPSIWGLQLLPSHKDPRVKRWMHVIKKAIEEKLEKARPYTRTRRGKMEHVKGYAGKNIPKHTGKPDPHHGQLNKGEQMSKVKIIPIDKFIFDGWPFDRKKLLDQYTHGGDAEVVKKYEEQIKQGKPLNVGILNRTNRSEREEGDGIHRAIAAKNLGYKFFPIVIITNAMHVKKAIPYVRTRSGHFEHVSGYPSREAVLLGERWKTRGAVKEKSDLPSWMQKYYRGIQNDEIQIKIPYGLAVTDANKVEVQRAVDWLKGSGAEWKYAGLWVFKAGFITSRK